MNNKYFTFLIIISILVVCSISSCKTDNKQAVVPQVEQTKQGIAVPRADENFVRNLYNQVDQIDYIYTTFDFSMSISEPSAIKGNIATLSGLSIGTIPVDCKPVGRQMFMSKGEMLAEADLYFTQGCQFLVFMEKEKPASGSMFNQTGIDFYNQVFAQAQGVNQ